MIVCIRCNQYRRNVDGYGPAPSLRPDSARDMEGDKGVVSSTREVVEADPGLIYILLRGPLLVALSACNFQFNCIFTVYPGSRNIDGTSAGFKWVKHLFPASPSSRVITTGNGLGRGLVLAVPNTQSSSRRQKAVGNHETLNSPSRDGR